MNTKLTFGLIGLSVFAIAMCFAFGGAFTGFEESVVETNLQGAEINTTALDSLSTTVILLIVAIIPILIIMKIYKMFTKEI